MLNKSLDGINVVLNRKFQKGDKINIHTSPDYIKNNESDVLFVAPVNKTDINKLIKVVHARYGYVQRSVHVANVAEATAVIDECFSTFSSININGYKGIQDVSKMSSSERELLRISIGDVGTSQIKKTANRLVDELGMQHTLDSAAKSLYEANECIDMMTAKGAINAAYNERLTRVRGYKTVSASIKVNDIKEVLEFAESKKECVIAVKGYTGCRKTTGLLAPVAVDSISQGLITTYLAHRRSIISSSMRLDGMQHYEEINPFDEEEVVGIKACVNSVIKPRLTEIINKTDVLLIDEVMQTLVHMIEGSVDECERVQIFKKLKRLIGGAKKVIIADADINDRAIELLRQSAREDIYVFELAADHSDITVNVANYDAVIPLIFDSIGKGEKVLVSADTKSMVKGLEKEFGKEEYSEKKILIIHADNIKDPQQASFIADPNNTNYDLVAFSPAITSSLSITNKNLFNKHFNLCGGTLLPSDIVQQIRRDRTATEIIVGIRNPLMKDYSADDISAYEARYQNSNPYTKYAASILADRIYQKAHFCSCFIANLEVDNFNVVIAENNQILAKWGKSKSKKMSKALKEAEINEILNAKAIDSGELKKIIEDGGEATKSIRVGVERSKVEAFFGKPDLSYADVQFWDKGKAQIQLDNLSLAMKDMSEILNLQKLDDQIHELGREKPRLKYELFSSIFEILGIDLSTGKGNYSVNEARLLLNYIYSNRSDYRAILFSFNIKISELWKTTSRPTSIANDLLKQLFKLKPSFHAQLNVKGSKLRYYKLDRSRFEKVIHLINRGNVH